MYGGAASLLCFGLLVWLAQTAIYAPLGGWVARQKRRNEGEGRSYGLVLGPLGVAILALLPNGPEPPRSGALREARPLFVPTRRAALRRRWGAVIDGDLPPAAVEPEPNPRRGVRPPKPRPCTIPGSTRRHPRNAPDSGPSRVDEARSR